MVSANRRSNNWAQEIFDCTRFPFVALFFFYKSGGLAVVLLQYLGNAFEYVGPYASGVFQTGTNEGDVGLTFNILYSGQE